MHKFAPSTGNLRMAQGKDFCRGASAPSVPTMDAMVKSRAELRRRQKKQQAYMFGLSQARPHSRTHNMASAEGNLAACASSVELDQAVPVGASLLDRPAKRTTKRTAKRTAKRTDARELVEFAQRQLVVQQDEAERRLQRLKAAELHGKDYGDAGAANQGVVLGGAAAAAPVCVRGFPERVAETDAAARAKKKEKKKQPLNACARSKTHARHGSAGKGGVGHCAHHASAAAPVHRLVVVDSERGPSGKAAPVPKAANAFSCCAEHNLIGCVLCSALATTSRARVDLPADG